MSDNAIEVAAPFKQGLDGMADKAMMVAASIENEETFNIGTAFIQGLNAEIDMIEDKIGPIRQAQHKVWQMTCSLIRELRWPRENAIKIVSDKQKQWRSQKLAQLEAEQRVKAEAERKRIEDQKLHAAEQLEKTNPKMADAILNVPTVVNAIPVEKMNTPGVSFRKRWVAQVNDKVAFVKMAAAKHEYLAAIKIDETELGRMATKLEGKLTIDGVEILRDDIRVDQSQRRSA